MKIGSRRIAFWTLAAVVAMTSACVRKGVRKSSGDSRTASHLLPEPGIHGAQFTSTPELKTVHFEFDRHYLRKEARDILKQNAEVIKRNPGWEMLIEGHCDNRGTIEYNLALGQNRAQAVREYYLLLGIPGNKVATISFGEEKPVCQDSAEHCWSRNRRAENKLKIGLAGGSSGPGP